MSARIVSSREKRAHLAAVQIAGVDELRVVDEDDETEVRAGLQRVGGIDDLVDLLVERVEDEAQS